MTGAPSAVQGCLEACRRCRVLVQAVADEEESLARRAYASIGPQVRHCLDHFHSFLQGLESGFVDYDARERDERLEREPRRALERLEAITERLRSVDLRGERRLAMRQEPAPDAPSLLVATNPERELLFLSSHTIHHLAIMCLLAERAGVAVPRELGVAFSTASWERRAAVLPRG